MQADVSQIEENAGQEWLITTFEYRRELIEQGFHGTAGTPRWRAQIPMIALKDDHDEWCSMCEASVVPDNRFYVCTFG